jgi:hypothetical protein
MITKTSSWKKENNTAINNFMVIKHLDSGGDTYTVEIGNYFLSNHVKVILCNSSTERTLISRDVGGIRLEPMEFILSIPELDENEVAEIVAWLQENDVLELTDKTVEIASYNKLGDYVTTSYPIAKIKLKELEDEDYFYFDNRTNIV